MLHTKGNTHNRKTTEKAEYGMCGRNFPPAEDNPQGIEKDIEAARQTIPVLHFMTEGPNGKSTELHQLRAEGNADDGDAEH